MRCLTPVFEPQAVGYHADATQRHGCPGDHRVQQKAADRVERPGSDRYAYEVVDKGPEEVLADRSNRLLGSRIASGIFRRSDEMMVICATSIAMSLPPPIAILKSA